MQLFFFPYWADISFIDGNTIFMLCIIDLYNYILYYEILLLFIIGFSLKDAIHYFSLKFKKPINLYELSRRNFLVKLIWHDESDLVEIFWTITPTIMLVCIGVPSFFLLYYSEFVPYYQRDIHITGNQWFWKYENVFFTTQKTLVNLNDNYYKDYVTLNILLTRNRFLYFDYCFKRDTTRVLLLYDILMLPARDFIKEDLLLYKKFHILLSKLIARYKAYNIIIDTMKDIRVRYSFTKDGRKVYDIYSIFPFTKSVYTSMFKDTINMVLLWTNTFPDIKVSKNSYIIYKMYVKSTRSVGNTVAISFYNSMDPGIISSILSLKQIKSMMTKDINSYALNNNSLHNTDLRLFNTTNPLVLNTQLSYRLLVTSSDVLHSWCVPAFGIKTDAIPGRQNQITLSLLYPGIFFGQCSELCGTFHGFMPIEIYVYNYEKLSRK